MKRKNGDDLSPPKAKRNKGKAIDHGFLSFSTNLFKNTTFEPSDDDYQDTPLLRKDENTYTILKATKEGVSVPGPSNVVINDNMNIEAVVPAPTPSTSRTSVPIKTSKKYKSKVDKTEALKKEKEKNKVSNNEQKQVRYPSCGGTYHSRSSSKLCSMNKAQTKLPKPKDTVEKTSFVVLIQAVVDYITQLVYPRSIFANYYFLELLENDEELPAATQNLFYNIFSTFTGQGRYASDSIKKSFKTFCESTSLTQSK